VLYPKAVDPKLTFVFGPLVLSVVAGETFYLLFAVPRIQILLPSFDFI
jgi:hypothetical protein